MFKFKSVSRYSFSQKKFSVPAFLVHKLLFPKPLITKLLVPNRKLNHSLAVALAKLSIHSQTRSR